MLLVANGLVVAGTFLLNLILARRLGPAGYAEWAALWALILVSSALFPSVVLVCARYVAGFIGEKEHGRARAFARRAGIVALLGGFALGAWVFYVRGTLGDFLKLQQAGEIALVAGFLGFSFVLSYVRGVIEGLQNFPGLSFNIGLEGVLRFVLGSLLLLAGFGVYGLLIGYLLAALIPIVTGFRRLAVGSLDLFGRDRSEPLPAGFARKASLFVWPVLLTHVLVVAWTNLDLLLVKHFVDDTTAGVYGVLFTAGKVAFFIAEALASVMIPKLAAAHASGGDEATPLRRTGAIVLVFCLGLLALCLAAPRLLVVGLLGPEFAGAVPFLPIYMLAAVFMALAVFATKAHLARGETGFLWWLSAGIVAVAAVVWVFGADLHAVVWGLAVVNAMILAAVAKPLWPVLRGKK